MQSKTEHKVNDEVKSHSTFTVQGADRLAICFTRDDVWKFVRVETEKIKAKLANKDANQSTPTPLINSAIGMPSFEAPRFVLDAAIKAINDGFNQYVAPRGATILIQQLATIYSKRFGFTLNGMDNIQATRGAAGAYDVVARTFLNNNDEVVILEPIWAYYVTQSAHFGGTVRSVRLDCIKTDSKYEWKLDINKLKAVLNKNSKFLVLNTPHNPTGFVLSLSQMKEIEKLLLEEYPQIIVITDEVYEYMVYDTDKDKQHYSIASISKEMWQRTITISSASKTLSVTGWRIGWIVANKDLMKYIRPAAKAHCGGGSHPLEIAVAESLKVAQNEYKGMDNYYLWLTEMYRNKRKRMMDAFISNGFNMIPPHSTYFMLVDVTDIVNRLIECGVLKKNEKGKKEDWQFVSWVLNKIGVIFIPCSAFDYDEADENRYFIRVSFCIKDEDIDIVKKRLHKLKDILKEINAIK